MLVLERKRDQRITIGGGITITVVEIRGTHVYLGIDAPAEVPILRPEARVQVPRMVRTGVSKEAGHAGSGAV